MRKVRRLRGSNPQPSPSKSDARSVMLFGPEIGIALKKVFFGFFEIMYMELKKFRDLCIDLEILAKKHKFLHVKPQIVALIPNQFTCNVCTYAQLRLTLFSV